MTAMPYLRASAGVAISALFAIVEEFAGVGAIGAAQHFHQGRFPGAVLAQQHVHFAARDLERDIVQRLHAGELLRNVAELK